MVSANFILPQSSFIWWIFIIESDNSANYMYYEFIYFSKIVFDTQMIIISDTLHRSIKHFYDTTVYHRNRMTGMVRRFDSPTLFRLYWKKTLNPNRPMMFEFFVQYVFQSFFLVLKEDKRNLIAHQIQSFLVDCLTFQLSDYRNVGLAVGSLIWQCMRIFQNPRNAKRTFRINC